MDERAMQHFSSLGARYRALLALAVLLDGKEAGGFLETDSELGIVLREAARELAEQPPEVRMPLVGTLLRSALEELGESGRHLL